MRVKVGRKINYFKSRISTYLFATVGNNISELTAMATTLYLTY